MGALVLRALPAPLARRLAAAVLAGSVAIDADHLPIALALARGDDPPRPRPHTFVTPAAIALAGAAAPRRARIALLGLALGTAVHLARDLFNGPGVAVAWPLSRRSVRLPVAAEAAAVTALALAARRRDPQ